MSVEAKPRLGVWGLCLAGLAAVFAAWIGGAPAEALETIPLEPEDAERAAENGPAPLRLQVLDAEGRPLAGARIAYRESEAPVDRGWFAPRPAIAQADEDGRFNSGETVAERFDLRVLAEGHALQTLREVEAIEPLTVNLERGYPVTGRVLAVHSGEGIEGARVELSDGEWFDFEELALRSTTDKAGGYRFTNAPAGAVLVRATGNGWASRSVEGEVLPRSGDGPPGKLDDLWLPKGGELAGRVVDDRGLGVADVKLYLEALEFHGGGRDRTFPPMWVRADESGHYEFVGVTAGDEYRVTATHDSYSAAVAGPTFVDVGTRVEDVDLVLRAGATLRFKIIDADERPCTRVNLRLKAAREMALEAPLAQIAKSTEDGGIVVDEDGWLSVPRLSPGRYFALLEPHGLAASKHDAIVLVEDETTDLGVIRLEAGARVQGRVLDAKGTPVALASVTLHWQKLAERHDRKTTSDPEGRFSIAGLPDHSLGLTVVASGFAERKLENVRAGSDEIVVTLERPGGLHGSVTLSEGGLPASFEVALYSDRRAVRPQPTIRTSAGAYEIQDLNPGVYEVQVRVPGRTSGRLERVRVRPGNSTDAGAIVLRPGLRVDGRVVDADGGGPVAGVSLRVDRGAGPPSWSGDTGQIETTSDAGGRFRLDEFGAGRYTLSLFHPDYAPAQRNLDMDAAVPRSEIEVRLTTGGEIHGIVLDPDGLPVAGANVTTYRGSPAFDVRSTTTATDGSFHFPRLTAGTCIVVLRYMSPGSRGVGTVTTVELREGELKRLELTAGKN